jgi:hypothetical protein
VRDYWDPFFFWLKLSYSESFSIYRLHWGSVSNIIRPLHSTSNSTNSTMPSTSLWYISRLLNSSGIVNCYIFLLLSLSFDSLILILLMISESNWNAHLLSRLPFIDSHLCSTDACGNNNNDTLLFSLHRNYCCFIVYYYYY